MRRETEFYEVEYRKFRLNAIIGAVIVFTLLLTGTFFALKSEPAASSMTDVQTAEAYQLDFVTE